MTWKEAWQMGAQTLEKAGVEEYQLDAWYLLEYVTGITKTSFIWNPSIRCMNRRYASIWS